MLESTIARDKSGIWQANIMSIGYMIDFWIYMITRFSTDHVKPFLEFCWAIVSENGGRILTQIHVRMTEMPCHVNAYWLWQELLNPKNILRIIRPSSRRAQQTIWNVGYGLSLMISKQPKSCSFVYPLKAITLSQYHWPYFSKTLIFYPSPSFPTQHWTRRTGKTRITFSISKHLKIQSA